METLAETIGGLPNISGSESLIEQAIRNRPDPVFKDSSRIDFGRTKSAAAPFVTGAIALLWSEFPNATAAQVKFAIMVSTIS